MLAFCFLAYRDIAHPQLWNTFFSGGDAADYCIFLHSKESISQSAVSGVQIVPTMPTEWGKWSLFAAQQRLIEQACESNNAITKVILLSSDAVPLWSFADIKEKLLTDDLNWIDITTRRTRQYGIGFHRGVRRTYTFGSQWVILNRYSVFAIKSEWTAIEKLWKDTTIPDEKCLQHWFTAIPERRATIKEQPPVYVNWARRSNENCPVEKHRNRPYTYCQLTEPDIMEARLSGALFMRKICRGAPLDALAPKVGHGIDKIDVSAARKQDLQSVESAQ